MRINTNTLSLFTVGFLVAGMSITSNAQESQVGGQVTSSQYSGASNTPDVGVGVFGVWRIRPSIGIAGRADWKSVAKSYRDGRGTVISGAVEVRAYTFPRVRFARPYLSAGIQAGSVSYPQSDVEAAYRKHSRNWRIGAGVDAVPFTAAYTYGITDPVTFDTLNGVRIGNHTRFHEVEGVWYQSAGPRMNLVVRGIFRRALFQQPYIPNLGTLKENSLQFGVGVSRVWRR